MYLLNLIYQFRWFGLSFTGLMFVDIKNRHYQSSKISNSIHSNQNIRKMQWLKNNGSTMSKHDDHYINHQTEPSFGLCLQRYLVLFYNLLLIVLFLITLVAMMFIKYLTNESNELSESNSTTISVPTILNGTIDKNELVFGKNWNQFLSIFSKMSYNQTEIVQLKPILRAIIDSLLFVLVLDVLVLIVYLLIRGRKLIDLLIRIPNIDSFDHSKQFAYRALGITFTLSCIINVLGFFSFNTDSVEELFHVQTNFLSRMKIILQLITQIIMFAYLAVIPILFIYTMMLFKFSINQLLNTFASGNDSLKLMK